MTLQTADLALVALGSLGDTPPHELQPTPLVDGIHLRWAFRRERGFPWFGYYLFRRIHRPAEPRCVEVIPPGAKPGGLSSSTWATGSGEFRSDKELVVNDSFGALGLDLSGRCFTRFHLLGDVAYRFLVILSFDQDSDLEVRVLGRGGLPVLEERVVEGKKGERVELSFEADAIGAIEISSGMATWVEACPSLLSDAVSGGWQAVPDLPYPLCLPVAHADYPCPSKPNDPVDAKNVAIQRIRYDDPARWEATFDQLHQNLEQLVDGGPPPSGLPMHQRENLVPPSNPAPGAPDIQRQRPLELALLASLHPAAAQMLGLYWVDQSVAEGEAWDYLVLADHDGSLGGEAASALAWLSSSPSFTTVDGWIAFDQRLVSAAPLEAPSNPRAFVLPGAQITDAQNQLIDAAGNVGLRWDLESDGFGSLRRDAPIFFHTWRAALGTAEPSSEAPNGKFAALTATRPVLVTKPAMPGLEPSRPAHWPDQPMHKIDRGLAEGWYSYRISAIDIFGRHSPLGDSAHWYQWQPVPDPRPWYYQDPPGERSIHPFATEVLDKNPPPAPAAVEAHVLDPLDPTVVRDAAFEAWFDSLSPQERESVVGLRVRWAWRRSQMNQAPDTREFRIYLHPGSEVPAGARRASSWQDRRAAVGFDEHLVSQSADERVYEIFLPSPGDAWHVGLDLETTLADPLRFAHVGVAAADDKDHTPDDPQRSSGGLGDRPGNEGPVSSPCKIFRVRRQPPPPPVPLPADSDRVYASRADYHDNSFYTFRFAPSAGLDVHVYRALDEAIFRADWALRPRPDLSSDSDGVFPDEPDWTEGRRLVVVAELNALNAFPQDPAGEALALGHYRSLGNDSLRVLAALPGLERSFIQRTMKALDPQAPDAEDPALLRWRDRVGPDTPADYQPDPALRSFVDTLDGRARNRYFYRSANVDKVHNRGSLGLSSPPVWLPDIVPPRTPALSKARAGDRQITLRWRANTERDLAAYRIFRSERQRRAEDLRTMDLVATVDLPAGPSGRPAFEQWIDSTVTPLVTYHYRLQAVDQDGNLSTPSPPAAARAFDDSRPEPPVWSPPAAGSEPESVVLSWTSPDPQLRCLVQRRLDPLPWQSLSGWLPRGHYQFEDAERDAQETYLYRLRVMDTGGKTNRSHDEIQA